ncbi:DUF6056 family protein [Enterococcus wangshanyuanii]|uniref:Uncharacterized protein n=1 Tax=Enterococcus wangshanyuanii TaxID=2005703 RepID=A0ABQ1PVD3_9ENTE|nr:DUF6056 family protein [Enterococcus wangshanyuanii]GGD04603.1 hypothetical protein GCM10011573_37650 [Enterococcus wangshanyuanii]
MNRVMTSGMNKNWFSKNSQLIGICILFLCITIYFSFFGIQKGTDDEWFKRVSEQKHFFDYIIHRYTGWSARIFPDAIMYFIFSMPLIVYSSITSASLLIAAYSIARIMKKTVSLFDMIVILAFFGWMNFPFIYHSFLWITGAVNYLWPLSLGLFAMIPYADYVFRGDRWTKRSWMFLSIFITLLFSISNEQYLLVGFCAAVCAHIALVISKKRNLFFY